MIKLKHLKEKLKKTLKNKGKPALAMVLCAALILPIAIHGAALTDSMYNSPHVSPGWDKNQYEKGMITPEQKGYKPTGMAYNGTWFNWNPNAGNLFPFLYAPYLSIRPGYEYTALIEDETVDFHLFDKRFIYCVASHIQNYSLEFGMQAFYTGRYRTDKLPDFVQGTDANKKFNFLMLAIACGYPADCNAEDWRHTPDYLVCQTIAWCVTNEKWNTGGPLTSNKGGAFKGVPEDAGSESILRYYKDDLAKYHSSAEYKSLSETFTQSAAPEIYNILHAPATGEAATIGGAADKIDEIFYKVWMAAHLTSKLKLDWEKSLTAAYTTAKQENDGYYHAYPYSGSAWNLCEWSWKPELDRMGKRLCRSKLQRRNGSEHLRCDQIQLGEQQWKLMITLQKRSLHRKAISCMESIRMISRSRAYDKRQPL